MTNIFNCPNLLLSATGDQTILKCAGVLMDRSKGQYTHTHTHPHTALLYSHHMYPGHVIPCHVIPYRAIYGRKSHGELICRFLHVIDERNRRIKEQSRDPHYIFFSQAEEGGCPGLTDQSEALQALSGGEVSLNFFLDGVWKPCNSRLGGQSKTERRDGRVVGSGWSSVHGLEFFFFLLFILPSIFLLGIGKRELEVRYQSQGTERRSGSGGVWGKCKRTGQIWIILHLKKSQFNDIFLLWQGFFLFLFSLPCPSLVSFYFPHTKGVTPQSLCLPACLPLINNPVLMY